MITVLALAALCVAFANGANDNAKGVVTLLGSHTASYRRAIAWATVTTFLGCVTAAFFADVLIKAFSGAGLVPRAQAAQPGFLAAVGIGAALTVLLATRFGFPVSTTHALLGALAGGGLAAAPGSLALATLGTSFALPLLLSPLVSLLLTVMFYSLFRAARLWLGVGKETCVCVGEEWHPVAVEIMPDGSAAAAAAPRLSVAVGRASACVERYHGQVLGIRAQSVLDAAHFLTAGLTGFARGLNDGPKIVALLVAAGALGKLAGLSLAAVAMGLGGIVAARRVARTMGERITGMNAGQGFTANLITSALVTAATVAGQFYGHPLPVSTTHVSCGALFGIGLVNRQARWGTIGGILLSWVATLPLAAVLAGGAALLLA